ncbi:VanZ family protein [Hallella bergensis]|uniref:VanZ family protein n=1 Tax=Hallella bergensis TaxID=242750 RepID=UPI0023F253BA|nr:VanZ family protein [Hallella bergensis]
MMHFIKQYTLSFICMVVIWILCLVPIPETPLSQINMVDKWTHIVMFGGWCTVLWLEYGLHHQVINMKRTIPYAIIFPILMGGLIEIVQQTCTGGNRSGDFIDFIADAIGVAMGAAIGIPLALMISKRNKDS